MASFWQRLTPHDRAQAGALVRPYPEWKNAVSSAARDPDPSARISAALAAGDDLAIAEHGLLARLLLDPDERVGAAAEHALRAAVERALSSSSGRLPDAAADEALDNMLAEAARTYPEHRRRGVLELAALMLTPGRLADPGGPTSPTASPLRRWFFSEDETQGTVRAIIRRAPDVRLGVRSWEWLGRSRCAAAPAALDRVASGRSPADHESLLTRAHLAHNPARRRLMTRPGLARAAPCAPDLPRLTPAARAGLARFAHIPNLVAEEVRTALARDSDAATRWLAGRRDREAGEARPDARIDAVRQSLEARRAGVDVLRSRLAAPDLEARRCAVSLVRRLRLAAEVELELLELLASPLRSADADRVTATAASALGECGTTSARQALEACLRHPVPRVRANAVEALGRMGRRLASRGPPPSGVPPFHAISTLLDDEQHRTRANAIRALLDLPEHEAARGAEDALASMLSDSRTPHRGAAVWLAERQLLRAGRSWARWNQISSAVADLTRTEPDPAVRQRAVRSAQRVLAAARAEWRERARALEAGGLCP